MKRPADDALLLAADWCEAYETDDDEQAELAAVAEWLRAQVELRQVEAIQRKVRQETGRTPSRAKVRETLASIRALSEV